MNQLSEDKQRLVLYMLGNGEGVRSVARITGVHRNTVMSLRDGVIADCDRPPRGLGRPSLGDKAKNTTILVRVTDAQYEAIKHAARNCKSVSEWIRRECRKEAKRILGDEYP